MGFGYKGYKWKWWWRPLVDTLTRCGFQDCANLKTIKRWFSLGERLPRVGIGQTPARDGVDMVTDRNAEYIVALRLFGSRVICFVLGWRCHP